MPNFLKTNVTKINENITHVISNEYNADPKNQFWKIIFAIYNKPFDSDYLDRCKFLLAHKLALWDVLYYTERNGALDSAISNEVPNDFEELFRHYPNIKRIVFNGTKAGDCFEKYNKGYYKTMICHILSSTSPTPGRHVKTLDEKKSEWEKAILRYTFGQ